MSASPRLRSPRLRSVSPVLDVAAKRLFSASADDRCLRNLTLKNEKDEDDPRARAVVQSRFASHRLSQYRGKLATVAGHLTAASKAWHNKKDQCHEYILQDDLRTAEPTGGHSLPCGGCQATPRVGVAAWGLCLAAQPPEPAEPP
eukprot:s2599_g5.t2